MGWKQIIGEFKSQVAFTLFLIWLLAFIVHFRTLDYLLHPIFAVGLMTVFDLGLTWVRSKKLYWPSASFVTGFLIGLIIDPKEPIWILALAVIAAWFAKQFINIGPRRHIFNPASFGIMTVAIAFAAPVSWWSVAWGKLPLLILIPAMIRVLFRMKRLWLTGGFLLVYLIYYLTLFDPKTAILAVADGSLLLFALVMLPEPMTSPAVGKYKYIFGSSVAAVSIALTKFNFAEVFLPALLFLNLVTFALRFLNKKHI